MENRNKIKLEEVTLVGIDCVDPNRLQKILDICEENILFGDVKLLTSESILEMEVLV